ncbi:unnamed protein product [Callosobruchus maculatus]|uniref:Uncharacterized protein n=1 Tax=Callosobruchus maculatus TaxID=64391 RepID=A0A653CG88_CALMS|nr:unnamed protein product [Callosobruchus maculatus]
MNPFHGVQEDSMNLLSLCHTPRPLIDNRFEWRILECTRACNRKAFKGKRLPRDPVIIAQFKLIDHTFYKLGTLLLIILIHCFVI